MEGNGIITSLSQKQNSVVNDFFFGIAQKDFLVRKPPFLFLYIILVLEMICYYLMSAQQA